MSRSQSLRDYILLRLMLAPLTIWTIVTVVFLLLRATPGDPADAILGSRAPEAAKEALREQLGLNAPLVIQYFRYLGDLLHLDLGTSLASRGLAVTEVIAAHFPATAELAIGAIAIAAGLGGILGAVAAARSGTAIAAGSRLFGTVTYALPMFWAGMVMQLIFAVQLGWFPLGTRFPVGEAAPATVTGLFSIDSLLAGNFSQFATTLHHLTLPCVTLGLLLSGIFERIVRVNLQQTLQADYVEAARARGISEGRILVFHALKNAMIPVVTVMGLTFSALLGGAVLTEVTFSWPGLGNRLYEAIALRDYPTVQGIMVFFGAIVVVASIAIDIINAWIDPRIRY